jgi:type II secretory pathway component PulJ
MALAELLVALALLSLIVGIVALGLDLGRQSIARTETVANDLRAVRGAQTALRRLVQSALPREGGLTDKDFLAFNGGPDGLAFSVRLPDERGWRRLYDIRVLLRSKGEDHSVTIVRTRRTGQTTDPWRLTVRLAAPLRFQYARSQGGLVWSDRWEPSGDIPVLVRASGSPNWPDFLAAPRIEHGPGCFFDAGLSRCKTW